MKISKSVQLATAGLLIVAMSACSSLRGPRPIDPNDASQYENLPTAPAVESLPTTKDTTSSSGVETGSANLGAPIEGNVIAAEPISNSTSTGNETAAELLKVRIYYFGTNLSDITSISYGGLNAHADYLKKSPQTKLQLSGHTDERGTREFNLALGERRANAVARYLVTLGVNANQLSVVSYGKEKPAADGHDEESWSQNRRVELDYVNGSPSL